MPEQGRRDKNDVFGGLFYIWYVFHVQLVPHSKVYTGTRVVYVTSTDSDSGTNIITFCHDVFTRFLFHPYPLSGTAAKLLCTLSTTLDRSCCNRLQQYICT